MNARTPFPDTLTLRSDIGAATINAKIAQKISAARDGVAFDRITAEPEQEATRAMQALPMTDLPVHDAGRLTQGGNQALIHLDGKIYTLRITRAGKLILTK
jgi:hemin uptake protein HemP